MSKLTAVHINIIGAVAVAVLAALLFYFMIKPKNEQLQLTQGEIDQSKGNGGTPEAVAKAKRDLATAKSNARKTEAAWNVNERRYMPSLAFSKSQQPLNLFQNDAYVDPNGYHFGLRDMPRLWGTWLEGWYAAQLPGTKFTGADDKSFIGIPSFSPDPNAISQLKAITFPETGKVWKMTVLCTTFDNAMTHLRRINTMQQHGMPVVNGVTLSGHSPALKVAYDMAMYIIPHADPPAADPLIAPGGPPDPNAAPSTGGFGAPPPGGGRNNGGG